ncbi:30S ribosomal protein S2 [Candidatus Peregrinibacteria bacterium]|nr:30S ribosomal protein S2 [Candidatus Peregrinibacteria bacterium]
MSEIPSLLDLLKAGAHFGHKVSRWHPKMAPYIFTSRGQIHLINLEMTQKAIEEAVEFARGLGKEGKLLLFVGTKKQIQPAIRQAAQECDLPYIEEKWLGGTLTNFQEIHKLVRRYIDLKDKQARGELAKYTKQEQGKFAQEIEKKEIQIGGLVKLTRLPDVIFIVDLKQEKTALKEAHYKKLPVIAICDTNVDPTNIKHPIPANDDATKTVELIIKLIAEAYKEGKAEKETVVATGAIKTIDIEPSV